MKIGLLSDTHGYLDSRLFQYFESCDEIWHAGDIGSEEVSDKLAKFRPLRAVHGNIDGGALKNQFPEDLWFECEGVNVWITHIGGYPPKYNPKTRLVLNQKIPDLFICGHSHILKVIRDKERGLLHINPGAAGLQGFHKIRTAVRFDVDAGKISKLEVIELGKRG